ncbi:Hypothetical predicted protein [Podarcis lilfordi]|uniref:Uncharacterized protein n=1 Tax=Podarcis lilfordi TaxID=74358 RepID=A0AA35KY57_9SAUR|nr:Hypothetical predicted protein [Podarcis lilfordi]
MKKGVLLPRPFKNPLFPPGAPITSQLISNFLGFRSVDVLLRAVRGCHGYTSCNIDVSSSKLSGSEAGQCSAAGGSGRDQAVFDAESRDGSPLLTRQPGRNPFRSLR